MVMGIIVEASKHHAKSKPKAITGTCLAHPIVERCLDLYQRA
jgi:hypothetical protein